MIARADAELASRAKDEFLVTLSHELRTPLTPILGWTRVLRANELDANQVAHALDVIDRGVELQQQLIEELLTASRAVTGKILVELEPVHPAGIVQHVIDAIRPTADARRIDIRGSLASDPHLVVMADPNRLRQAVWSVVSNAVKFSRDGDDVDVMLAVVDDQAAITISDHGEGIDADDLPCVFDRFGPAGESGTRRHRGLRLGLSVARHLIELHGGTISAASPGAGQGAAFTIRLPLAKGRRADAGARPEPVADGQDSQPRRRDQRYCDAGCGWRFLHPRVERLAGGASGHRAHCVRRRG